MRKLSTLQKILIRVRGYALVDHEQRDGWREPHPIYAFRCPKHGIVESYTHGHKQRLDCPLCVKELTKGEVETH